MNGIEEEKKLKILRATPFFKPFTDEELAELLHKSRWLRYNYGDILFREGERDNAFYVILKGSVTVMKRTGVAAMKKTINTLGAGQCFGEMAVLTGEPRSADVSAAEEAFVLKVKAETIQEETASALLKSVQFKFFKIFCGILAGRLSAADRELAKPF